MDNTFHDGQLDVDQHYNNLIGLENVKSMVNNGYRTSKGRKSPLSDMFIAAVKVRIKLFKCVKN